MGFFEYFRNGKNFKGFIKTKQGFKIWVDTSRSDMDKVLFKHREHETKTLNLMKETLKEGDIFLDVGANIGYFSLYASQLVGKSGLVIAIEPNKEAYNDLMNHANNTKYDNIRTFEIGFSNKNKKLKFIKDENLGHSMVSKKGTKTINCFRGDNFLDTEKRIKLCKVDVEGHELEVLEGLKGLKIENLFVDGWNLQ